MRVLVKFEIDCDADAAWRAIHAPATLAELYAPLMRIDALGAQPTSWNSGDEAAMTLRLGGVVPTGTQLVHLTDSERIVGGRRVRIMRDSGIPLTGPLAALTVWDHQMAVSEAPTDPARTLWRERLTVGGRAAPALWPALWSIWQWRQGRIQALARTWAFEPEPTPTQ